MIKTSIIVPVYNTAEYLWECFESIFAQTQEEIEVIAVNDGSTDDSAEVLAQIQQKYPQLIIVSQENKGLGSARNKGMELAGGEFIYFMDSDDCLAENAMEICYRYAAEYSLDLLMFDAIIFGEVAGRTNDYDRSQRIKDQETVLSGVEYANRYWADNFCPSACLIYTSAKFLRDNQLTFLPGVYYEDNEFHCRSMLLAKRVMYIPQMLYQRRYRAGSIMMSEYSVRKAHDLLQVITVIAQIPVNAETEDIMRKMELIFLQGLFANCQRAGLLTQGELLRKIYEAALLVCGHKIEAISRFGEIDFLYRITKSAGNESVLLQEAEVIAARRKNVVSDLLAGLDLHVKGHCVGVYGTGRDAERFFNIYRECVGEIKAELVLIDSYAKTGTIYENGMVYNVNDIGELPLECIIIASSKYEEEMYSALCQKYGDRFKMIGLRKDLDL